MSTTETKAPKKPSLAKSVIEWKDPDFHPKLAKWGEFSEYFVADVAIDPKTGEGTIKLRKP